MPTVIPLSFGSLVNTTLAHSTNIEFAKQRALKPTPKWHGWLRGDDPTGSKTTTASASGWANLRNVYSLLERFDKILEKGRNTMQRRAHDYYIQASLRAIFGGSFAHCIGQLKRMFHLTTLKQEALVAAGRRMGKTWCTCMFCAAVLIACAGMTIAVFSTGRRASRSFLVQVYQFVCMLGYKSWVDRGEWNQETMVLVHPDNENDKRKISSFPSRPEYVCVCGSLGSLGSLGSRHSLLQDRASVYWPSSSAAQQNRRSHASLAHFFFCCCFVFF